MIDFLRAGDADGIEKALHQHIKDSFESFSADFYKNMKDEK